MLNCYQLDVIPLILKNFEVKNIIICGAPDNNLLVEIEDFNAEFSIIEKNINNSFENMKIINDYPLNSLKTLSGYDAIFINDDANWYTVYNELKFIKNNNEEFPLTFVCNNKFPNNLRDSYRNPDIIPEEYRHEYAKQFPITHDSKEIYMDDGYFHAVNDSYPRNGVSRAINDFLNENDGLDVLDINLTDEITVIYPKSTIGNIRIDKLKKELEGKSVDLNGSTNMIQLQNELNLKNNEIDKLKSELNLKESQINSIESKLYNKSNELNNSYSQLNTLQNDFADLKNKLNSRKSTVSRLNNNLRELKNELNERNDECGLLKNEVSDLKKRNSNQLSKIESVESSNNYLNETITEKDIEIQYLKKNIFLRKILAPAAYLILIFNSKPSEIFLNIRIYKNLKTSGCFDVGHYLNCNKDILESKWYKYFSPELHYVCKGFDENRSINKKYFHWNSKKELLNYLSNSK